MSPQTAPRGHQHKHKRDRIASARVYWTEQRGNVSARNNPMFCITASVIIRWQPMCIHLRPIRSFSSQPKRSRLCIDSSIHLKPYHFHHPITSLHHTIALRESMITSALFIVDIECGYFFWTESPDNSEYRLYISSAIPGTLGRLL